MRVSLVPLLICALTIPTVAFASGPPPAVASRAKGAQKVVIARVSEVQPRFDTNRYGDRLIVSEVVLDVEQTLKGTHVPVVRATVEGGTIGELTLKVSDMPELKTGDRAVFFLDAQATGGHTPHGRGFGIMKLDRAGRIGATNQTVEDVRRAVRSVAR